MGVKYRDKMAQKLSPHMGQFLQGLRVTKPDEIDFIVQLILSNCVLKTLETPLLGLRIFFGVMCSTPNLALLSSFWPFLGED